MTLTQDQIDHFRERGFLVYGPLLKADEIEVLRREYDHEFALAEENGRYRNLAISDTPDLAAKRNAPRRMLQIMQMCERNLHFRRLIYDARILDVFTDLLGPNLMLFHDQALFKPARHGGVVTWHQDNAYWKCHPANLVSCWLTLDDVDVHNGAMHLLPGSHLRPAAHQTSKETGALLETDVGGAQPVIVDLPAGGCMFHHCQTLHYTPPNNTERQRRAFAIHVMPPGTRGRDGQIMPVSFARPMLRASV